MDNGNRFISYRLVGPVSMISSFALNFLLLIIRSPNNCLIPVTIPTLEKLIGVWVVDVSTRATLFPNFNIIVEGTDRATCELEYIINNHYLQNDIPIN